MDKPLTAPEVLSDRVETLPFKKRKVLKMRGIFMRTFLHFAILSLVIIVIFSLNTYYQVYSGIQENLKNEALSISASLSGVLRMAVKDKNSDYGLIVEHCQNLIKERENVILGIAIVRNDGFGLEFDSAGWRRREHLPAGCPVLGEEQGPKGRITLHPNLHKRVYHYFAPITSTGYRWGTIHLDLCAAPTFARFKETFLYTVLFMLISLGIALFVSFWFATRLIRPIAELCTITKEIASGNLDARAGYHCNDEIGNLCSSLNQMAENLRQTTVSKEYADNIIYNMNEILLVVSQKEGLIRMANHATEKLLGYKKEDIRNQSVRALIYEEDREEKERWIAGFLEKGVVQNAELTFLAKGGKQIPVLFSSAPMQTKPGADGEIICLALDISGQKQAVALQRQKAMAEAANQAKNAFLAKMSHEIRTPLHGILGMAEWGREKAKEEELTDIFDNILYSAGSLNTLVNDILDYSRIQRKNFVLEKIPFDLRELMDDLGRFTAMKANRKGLAFHIFVSPDIPSRVTGDQKRLWQVFANLVDNAVKFTEKGEITMKAGLENETDSVVTIGFQIKDTGIGISREKQELIFESFIQADPSLTRQYGGSGLGTTISRHLVEMMGGNICLRSQPGKGSEISFTVVLEKQDSAFLSSEKNDWFPDKTDCSLDIQGFLTKPFHRKKMASATNQVMKEALPEKKGKKFPPRLLPFENKDNPPEILLAEDNPTSQIIAAHLLEQLGARVEIASNGREVVRACQSKPYDLILMDIEMPKLNGLNAARIIRNLEEKKRMQNNQRQIPIIALSAGTFKGVEKVCMEAGMNGYAAKPLRKEELVAILEKWVYGFSAENHCPKNEQDGQRLFDKECDTFFCNAKHTGEITESPPINFLETLKDFEQDTDLVEEVLREFVKNARKQIKKMKKAVQENDHGVVKKESHSIKGGAANLLAWDVFRAAEELNDLVFPGEPGRCNRKLQTLEYEVNRLEAYCKGKLQLGAGKASGTCV